MGESVASGVLNERRESFKTWLVSISCLVGAAIPAHFLYEDLHSDHSDSHAAVIGRVIHQQGSVRRRASDSYLWNRVEDSQEIRLHDTVLTGEESWLRVQLEDGRIATLEIGPNSLVKFDRSAQFALPSFSGDLVVHDQSGDTRLSRDSDGNIKREIMPISLGQPENFAKFVAPPSKSISVEFSWNLREPEVSNVLLEVSSRRDFSSASTLVLRPDSKLDHMSASLSEGAYWWRVARADGKYSQVRRFQISTLRALEPVFPVAADRLGSFDDSMDLTFRWRTDQGAAGAHFLELADDIGFSQRVIREAVDPGRDGQLLKGLKKGRHYWRLVSQNQGVVVQSRAELIEIIRFERANLTLVSPPVGALLTAHRKESFQWRSDPLGLSYVIEAEPISGGEIRRVRSDSMGGALESFDAGEYHWRMQAEWKGRKVGETPWSAFTVVDPSSTRLVTPKNDEKITYWKDPPPFEFTWVPDSSTKAADLEYEVQISSSADLSGDLRLVKSDKPTLSSQGLGLLPNHYYWRVVARNRQHKIVGFSDISVFHFGPRPLLPAPAGAFPGAGTNFQPVLEKRNPHLSWTPVPDAAEYELNIYSRLGNGRPGKLMLSKQVLNPELEISGLAEGNYTWKVHAIDPIARPGFPTSLRSFDIHLGAPLGPPKALGNSVQ